MPDVPRRGRRALDPLPEVDPSGTVDAVDPDGGEGAEPRRTQWMPGPAENGPARTATPDAEDVPGDGPLEPPAVDAEGSGATSEEGREAGATPPATATAAGGGAVPPRRGPSRAIEPEGNDRRRTILLTAIALVAVVAVVVAAVLLRGRASGEGPGASPTPDASATPVLAAALLEVAEVSPLDEGAAWAATTTQDRVDADTPRPHCLALEDDDLPLPQSSRIRRIQAGDDPNHYVLHEAFHYTSVEDATAAASLWTQQLGGCERPVSLLLNGWNIGGVGDAASGVTVVVQDSPSVGHTVQVARTGSVVHVVDAARAESAPDGVQVANLLATVVGRTCEAAEGACADSPSASSAIPPQPAEAPEFLANADLPRITPGTGRWGSTSVATSFDFFGTQCESRDLASVSGPETREHRAYLLQEDAAAPEGTFGVDEYILTYPDKAGADTLVKDLTDSISACGNAMLTATVEDGATIETTAAGQAVTGRTWLVTQQVSQATKQRYRVAVVQVDRHVIYLLIPTGESFDFSSDQWNAVAERAGQRLASTL